MGISTSTPHPRCGLPGYRWLALATVIATYLLIVLGAFTRVSGSGMGCGNDWPLCHGQLLPPIEFEPIVEWTHRFVGWIIGSLIILTALGAWIGYRANPLVLWPATAALPLVAIQGLLGAVTVKLDLPPAVVATHMANALLVLAAVATAALAAWLPALGRAPAALTGRVDRPPRSFARLAMWTAIFGYITLVSGALVRASGSELACRSWPFCGDAAAAGRLFSEIHMGHRYVTLLFTLLLAWTCLAAWRHRAVMPKLARHTLGILVLTLVQVVAGGVMVLSGLDAFWRGFHVAVATAVWLGLVALALLASVRARTEAGGEAASTRRDETSPRRTPASAGGVSG